MKHYGKPHFFDYKRLINHLIAQFSLASHSVHGPSHWRRVERNGLYLAEQNGADWKVVQLFALFHDSRRLSEGRDSDHGTRGGELASQLRSDFYELDDARFELLYEACCGHTDIVHHEDVTIGACWDADRLDLPRVGRKPNPIYLNTSAAKKIARDSSFRQLEKYRSKLAVMTRAR